MNTSVGYDKSKHWKIVIPWRREDGTMAEYVLFGEAKADPDGTGLGQEIIDSVNLAGRFLVAEHPEAANQLSDVRVYHPGIPGKI